MKDDPFASDPFENEALIEGDVMIPYEKNPGAMWTRDRIGYFRNALMKFGRMMKADFYAAPPGESEAASYHYLNSASLPNPVREVRDAARQVFELWSRGELTEERQREIVDLARKEAAALVNLRDERGVVLCRNASEALSYFLWLSGIMEKKEGRWPLVLSTDVENPSIQREIFIIQDHSNIDRTDPITTYPEFGSQRAIRYTPPVPRATELRWGHFSVMRVEEEQSLEELESFIQNEKAPVLIMSHVLRTTGRVLPVAEWTKKAREWRKKHCPEDPEIFVCIDGAQALGNIEIDFASLDCDMYVGCAQKALQGETAGLLFFDPENPRIREGLTRVRALTPDTQVILRNMFHPDLGVEPNVDDDISYADLAGFNVNMHRLREAGLIDGHRLTALTTHRQKLKDQCAEGLRSIAAETGYQLEILDEDRGTPFILGFRFGPDPFELHGRWERGFGNPEGIFEPGAMHNEPLPTESWGKTVAEKLNDKGVGITLLRRGMVFRVSFSDQSTEADVGAFLAELPLALREALDASRTKPIDPAEDQH